MNTKITRETKEQTKGQVPEAASDSATIAKKYPVNSTDYQ
jgi:hypothetical protein